MTERPSFYKPHVLVAPVDDGPQVWRATFQGINTFAPTPWQALIRLEAEYKKFRYTAFVPWRQP